jgi:reverse transcriptase-like protein
VDSEGASSTHFIDDDEDFIFHSEFDTLILATAQDASDDPKSLNEAHLHSDWLLWKAAMDKEIDTLEKANTWSTVQHPANKNIIGSKWVFCIKCKADGSVDKYKAHLVAQGFS